MLVAGRRRGGGKPAVVRSLTEAPPSARSEARQSLPTRRRRLQEPPPRPRTRWRSGATSRRSTATAPAAAARSARSSWTRTRCRFRCTQRAARALSTYRFLDRVICPAPRRVRGTSEHCEVYKLIKIRDSQIQSAVTCQMRDVSVTVSVRIHISDFRFSRESGHQTGKFTRSVGASGVPGRVLGGYKRV